MATPNVDFANYMEDVQQAEAARVEHSAMLGAHEVWRQTTWGGWLVRKLQDLGNHFRPFFLAVGDAVSEERSISHRLLSHFLRMSVVLVILIGIYSFAKLFQIAIGDEIVSEQEIVIVEEIPRSRAEREGIVEGEVELSPAEAKARLAQMEAEEKAAKQNAGPRRSARQKKKQ